MAGPDNSQSGQPPERRVFFEFQQLGQQIRVAAIDEATGIEVVVICPPQLGYVQMQRLALQKLRHKLGLPADPPPPAPPRPGKWA
jgi:hypothetical protein